MLRVIGTKDTSRLIEPKNPRRISATEQTKGQTLVWGTKSERSYEQFSIVNFLLFT